MKLKQIRIEFSPLQDWLLMRIATDANTEVLLWLTRRCVKLLWPALMGLAQKSPDILLQSHPDAKTALLGMRHEAAVQKGDFSQPYDETALVRPLKLLTTVASTTAITIHRTTFFARSFNALDLGCFD